MTYTIAKEFKIINYEDGFSYDFSADEYGTVFFGDGNGATCQTIQIPKDCIQCVIDVLEQFK
jgi:hypothetical protein